MAQIVTSLDAGNALKSNALELAIRGAHAGTVASAEVLQVLAASKLAVPSKADVHGDLSELRAVVLDKDGKSFVAVFTTVERAQALRNMAASCVMVDSLALLEPMEADLGLVINPGTDVVMEISAEGVRRIVKAFGKQAGDAPAEPEGGN